MRLQLASPPPYGGPSRSAPDNRTLHSGSSLDHSARAPIALSTRFDPIDHVRNVPSPFELAIDPSTTQREDGRPSHDLSALQADLRFGQLFVDGRTPARISTTRELPLLVPAVSALTTSWRGVIQEGVKDQFSPDVESIIVHTPWRKLLVHRCPGDPQQLAFRTCCAGGGRRTGCDTRAMDRPVRLWEQDGRHPTDLCESPYPAICHDEPHLAGMENRGRVSRRAGRPSTGAWRSASTSTSSRSSLPWSWSDAAWARRALAARESPRRTSGRLTRAAKR